jgi:protein-S-isoprenylcysteine O-methyltransferase Ste14
MKFTYPQLLVLLQFGLMGLMLFLSNGIISSLSSILIFFVGLSLGIWAIMHNQVGNFNIQPKMKEGSSLVTTGIYQYIRHPMYSAVIIMMTAVVLVTPTAIEGLLLLLLIMVLFLKAKREEEIWSEANEAYEAYRQRTKYFIPFIL